MDTKIRIHFRKLHLPFKLTIRHASATRKEGECIWVKIQRGDFLGFGEGCPRSYVTNETLDSSFQWLVKQVSCLQSECRNLDQLITWQKRNANLIDEAPSAWCAVECAALDLFSREHGFSVETLLGRNKSVGRYAYTGVLTDSNEWRFAFTADYYLTRGLNNFKVKLSGNLEKDRQRLKLLLRLCSEYGLQNKPQIRLDANNLWPNHPEIAIDHLRQLDVDFAAIEEPVGARDVESLSRISLDLNCPIILDESLCTIDDLRRFDGFPGRFIANIKVSKVGGILRGLKLIEAIREHGWPIIIGAHVGESSLLTRAGMLLAQAAGDALFAHEGAFGSALLEWDPAEPDLKFGHGGIVDLTKPYAEKTPQGLRIVGIDNWENGWGLKGCMPYSPESNADEKILKYETADGYTIHYRLWGKKESGEDLFVILHGGMSHSGWQYPLAQAIQKKTNISVIAPDRRGCGLNDGRGDLGTTKLLIQDLVEHLSQLKKSYHHIHLAGWCQGAQFASIAADALQHANILTSLNLITPGFFWNDRFRSIIDISEKTLFSIRSTFKIEPARDNSFVPIPMQASDFTFSPEWMGFIHEDRLKTTKINMKSALIMDEIQEMSWSAIMNVKTPIFMILASRDRIVDNRKANEYLMPLIKASSNNRITTLDTAHAVQFEKPDELAEGIISFINNIKRGV